MPPTYTINHHRMDTFFTLDTFATVGGCVLAVVTIVNTIRHAFGYGPNWLGLLVALFVSIGAYILKRGEEPFAAVQIILVLMNTALIYTTAFGVQNTVIHKLNADGELELQGAGTETPRWTSAW